MKRGLLLLPLLAVVAVAVAAAWAFRGDDALDLDLDPVASAATQTSDAGSARIASETAMRLNGRRIVLRGQGEVDFDESRGRMTLDVSPLLPKAAKNARFEMRTIGSTIYFRTPA